MTKKQTRKKTRKLIHDVSKDMRKNLDRILKQNMVNCSKFDDNWLLPKAILMALLLEEQHQYAPPQNNAMNFHRKLSKEIYAKI